MRDTTNLTGKQAPAFKAPVIGVSVDPLKSHAKFIKQHSLPFPLISDETKAIVQACGVWVEKSMYGKKYMGTERSTWSTTSLR